MPTVQIIIKGKVHGVFYRATAKKVADEIGVKGWVKNVREGSVDVVATGTKQQLQKIIEWCRRGPPGAIVTEVIVIEKEEELFKKFTIVR